MTLHKTNEIYINLLQEDRSYELTISRIEDFIIDLGERFEEDDIQFWQWNDRGYQVFSIGLGDIYEDFAKVELVTFLSDLLNVHRDEIKDCDYIHFRKF